MEIPEPKNFFRETEFTNTSPLAVEIKNVLLQLDRGSRKVSMKPMLNSWGWKQGDHHDAAEFVDLLLTKLD